LSRLLVAYISTGVVFMLLPGTFLGVWLIPISAKQAAAQVSAAWSQAHGHAQQAEDWHGISIGRRPMPTTLKRSTASITRTRCWNTRSQASEPAVDATYRTNALVSRAKSGLLSDESLAAVIFGSPNSS